MATLKSRFEEAFGVKMPPSWRVQSLSVSGKRVTVTLFHSELRVERPELLRQMGAKGAVLQSTTRMPTGTAYTLERG